MSTTRVKYELEQNLAPYGITVGNSDRVKYVEAAYDTAMRAADTQKESAITAAGDTLAGSLAGAEANYKRARVNYGVTAERMAQAGLTGSGYSDNLDRDAYAMRQASMDKARVAYGDAVERANYTYGDAKTKAETAAIGSLAGIYETENKEFNQYLADVKSGVLTPKEAETIAARYSADSEQNKMLTDAIGIYKAQAVADLDAAALDGSITPAMIETAVAAGVIDGTKEGKYIDDWKKLIRTGADAFVVGKDENGADVYMSGPEALRVLQEYENHEWLQDEDGKKIVENLRKSYADKYGKSDESGKLTFTTKATAKYRGGAEGAGWKGNVGDNFSVSVGEGDDEEVYLVESGGEVTDAEIKSVATNVEEETVFPYANKLYIKHNGRVFLVQERPWAKKRFRALQEKLGVQ